MPGDRSRILLVALLLLGLPACAQVVPANFTIPDVPIATAQTPLRNTDTTLGESRPHNLAVPQAFQGPLSVIITSPSDGETVTTSPVQIEGGADAGTVITIGEEIILVDQSREFSVQIPLEEGTNLIEITASDRQNNQGFAYLTLIYEPADNQ